MNQDTNIDTPSRLLAQKIVKRLIDEGLLGKEYGASIVTRLEEGKVQGSDWKLVFEKSSGMHKRS